jgi:predicted metal-dependent hydrolase
LVFYAWLRLEAGLSPAESFAEATRRATDARRVVEIRDLRLPAV